MSLKHINKILTATLLLFGLITKAEKEYKIKHIISVDSTLYHIEKVNNSYWAGGKKGVLKEIYTNGKVVNINYPNSGTDILNITDIGEKIVICKDKGELLVYEKSSKKFTEYKFEQYSNKCFYDFEKMNNNSLILCGGTSGIAKANKKLPKGFILELDSNFQVKNELWKSTFHFPWSIENVNGKLYTSIYNGAFSKIGTINDNRIKASKSLYGLVHHIENVNNEIWYSGSKSIRYKQHGIVGRIESNKRVIKNAGCIWTIKPNENGTLATSNNSGIITIDSGNISKEETESLNVFYDFAVVDNSNFIVIGRENILFLEASEPSTVLE